MTYWRLIETAPKDGTHIDVWVQSFAIKAGKLIARGDGSRLTNVWWGTPYYGDDRKWEKMWVGRDGAWTDPIETETYSITHWMPLPAPPEGGR